MSEEETPKCNDTQSSNTESIADPNIPTASNTTYITLSPRSSPDLGRKKIKKKKKPTTTTAIESSEVPSSDDDRDQSLSSYPESKEDEDTPIDARLSLKLRDENAIMKKKIERKHLEEESDSQMSSSPGSENSLLIQR